MKNCAFIRRSWAEVDLRIIKENYFSYVNSISSDSKIMAVVKADAYGHGDVEVALSLNKCGVSDFAVSNISEACRLRNAGITGQILILGYTPLERMHTLLENNITQTIVSKEYAEELKKLGIRVKCQFAIDTGMNRIGLDSEDMDECERIIRYYSQFLNVTGFFTHLCYADTDTEEARLYTSNQIRLFDILYHRIADLNLKYFHCLNSAGGLWHNSEHSCFVRLGIVLYGLKPDFSNQLPNNIKPALSWKSVISMVKRVHKGEKIGYGCSYEAEKDIIVATIPTGYADGYNRLLSNKGFVLINGYRAYIVGRVCMDQIMVDVTNIPDVKMEDEVILIGNSGDLSLTADEMASLVGTIGYEIVCDISKRVPRVYIN